MRPGLRVRVRDTKINERPHWTAVTRRLCAAQRESPHQVCAPPAGAAGDVNDDDDDDAIIDVTAALGEVCTLICISLVR